MLDGVAGNEVSNSGCVFFSGECIFEFSAPHSSRLDLTDISVSAYSKYI